jgi:hypothetical protein
MPHTASHKRAYRRSLLIAGIAASAFLPLIPTASAGIRGATLDAAHPELRWTGTPAVQSAGVSEMGCLQPVMDPTCKKFIVTVGALNAAANDVQIAIGTTDPAIAEFDLYVYDSNGKELARSTDFGSNDQVIMRDIAQGRYTVAVQNVLSTNARASYSAVARAFAAPPGVDPVDVESKCGLESTPKRRPPDPAGVAPAVGDPLVALAGAGTTDPIDLNVMVILDGITQAEGEQIFTAAATRYTPLNINMRVVRWDTHSFGTDDSSAIIKAAKVFVGGTRPAGVDVVEVLTATDIQQLGIYAIAGLADCVGGVAHDDRAFLVAEGHTPTDYAVGPGTFGVDANANVSAHEIGHLMGGQHHYGNCVEETSGDEVHDGTVSGTFCTLMFNAADFLGEHFSTLNAAIVRGTAVRYLRD